MSAPQLAGHGAVASSPDTSAARVERRIFHVLDALRGLAAVAVVLFHASFIYGVKPPEGYLAVDLFFVMSGFVIAHRYDAELARGLGVRRFLAIRLVRLYPLYLLGTVLGLVPSVLTLILVGRNTYHEGVLSALPLALFMLPSRAVVHVIPVLYPLNFVSWSLALELFIDIAYAMFHRCWSPAVLVVVVALGFVGLCLCAAQWQTLQVGFEWPHAAGGFARVVFSFAMGVLIHRLSKRGLLVPKLPWWLPLGTAVLLFALPPGGDPIVWELIACTCAVPLIVATAVTSELPRSLQGISATAGALSYALYSLHVPLIGLFLRAEQRMHLDVADRTMGHAIAFTLVLGLASAAAYAFYDKPARRALSNALLGSLAMGRRWKGDAVGIAAAETPSATRAAA